MSDVGAPTSARWYVGRDGGDDGRLGTCERWPVDRGASVMDDSARAFIDEAPPVGGAGREAPRVGRSSIGRNLLHLLSSQAVTWALSMVLVIVQPRILGPEAQGRLRLAFSLWAIAGVVIALGTSMYLQLEVARRGTAALRLIGPILALRTAVALVTGAVFVAVAVPFRPDAETAVIIALYGLATLFLTWSEVYTSAFVGLEQMSSPAMIAILSKVLLTVVGLVVLVAGGGAIGVTTVIACANALTLVLTARALRRRVRVPLEFGWSQWPGILRGGLAFLATGAILTAYLQVDTIVISLFVDSQTLGWYSASDALYGTLLFLPTIVGTTIFPVLGRLYGSDNDAFVALVRRTFTSLAFLAVPIGLGTLVVGRTVAPLLYGDAFRQSGDVLSLLGVVLMVTSFTILFGTIALATGRQRSWNLVMLASVLLTIPLDVVFVPWADRVHGNGAIGGAMSYLVTEIVMFSFGLWRVAPFIVERATASTVARIAMSGLAMVAVTWPTRERFILVPVAVGAATFLAAVVVFRAIPSAERELARRLVGRLRPGVRTTADRAG